MTPRATYRLQLHKDFGFEDAAELAPYLVRLGVSHVYCSPYFKARPGSTHGYDVVDHNAFNPELGGEAGFRRMCAAFEACGLKQVVDFVPNHVGVWGADNPAWLDVLEWGEASDFAGWFDIDWAADREELKGRLLAPVLGDQYGAVLDAGQLELKFDAEAGGLAVWAYDAHKLPICPHDYGRVLGQDHPELERLADAFSTLREFGRQAGRRADELKAELAALARERADVAAAVEARLARFNAPDAENSRGRLDALIRAQHWRPAHFRVAADEINYRRFFNINDLAGVRVELPEVFDEIHRLLFQLVDEGLVDGVRIDHVDGLLDPKAYLARLRERIGPDVYLVVEKILAEHESLREDWPVDGTTGYEFANLATGLLVDPEGEAEITAIYRDFTGERLRFADLVRDCKLRIMDNEMEGELQRLARDAARIARQNPRTADFTQNILKRAIRQVVAAFPVYRTYVDETNAPTADDRRDLDWALAQARRGEADLDPSVFDFLHRLVSGELAAPRSGFSRQAVLRLAMKLQQYSGPVMAKGLEDTAFYRFNRLVALNEVGGEPERFGVSLAAFHKANQLRAQRWPAAMLAGSTHDTKRGEDARARLAALSEIPEEWGRQVGQWSRLLRARRGDMADDAPPDRNDEYLFYQMLVGSWPVELLGEAEPDPAALGAYAGRIKGALVKSMREAKLRSSWAAPNAAYEAAMLGFAELALDPARSSAFLGLLRPFVARVAELGARNSLLQAVLRLTVPGVPDIYQGAELWDLSLVDPDNRRLVDFAARAGLLEAVATTPAANLDEDWRSAAAKLSAVARLLALRRRRPELFVGGSYEAVAVEGEATESTGAFLRRTASAAMLVVFERFPARERDRRGRGPTLELPHDLAGSSAFEVLREERFDPGMAWADGSLLSRLPAAVLVWEPD